MPHRGSPRHRWLATVGLGLALLALVVVIGAGVYLRWRIPGGVPGEELAVEQCRTSYRQARSSTDTAIADEQRPIISREQATVARTCRELRLAGALR